MARTERDPDGGGALVTDERPAPPRRGEALVQPWLSQPAHHVWLASERDRLLTFGTGFPVAGGGAAWLDERGAPDTERPVHTWITARMMHVYALGALIGLPGAGPLVDAGLAGLTGPLQDQANGGWFPSVDGEGGPGAGKACYDHAFVMLAASSAALAERPGARGLLEAAAAVFEQRFWDEAAGMCVDTWDTTWERLDPYRGVNGNMHAVEAMLAVADVLGDESWRARAVRIVERVVGWGWDNKWRIPEHFDANWVSDLEYNRDRPDDPFKPYGATVGHGLEWARLFLHLEAALGREAPDWLLEGAERLFDRAVTDGWAVDGQPGFVYTTDWDGAPIVHDRMHWVAAEAVSTASALHARTGQRRYADLYALWWEYIASALIDPVHGSWHHQLDPQNRVISTVWPGKPDLYHAVQATLIPRLPLAPTLATALGAGALK